MKTYHHRNLRGLRARFYFSYCATMTNTIILFHIPLSRPALAFLAGTASFPLNGNNVVPNECSNAGKQASWWCTAFCTASRTPSSIPVQRPPTPCSRLHVRQWMRASWHRGRHFGTQSILCKYSFPIANGCRWWRSPGHFRIRGLVETVGAKNSWPRSASNFGSKSKKT